MIGFETSPGRRKYDWSEWTSWPAGTVCTAAESAWPRTCPPKTVPQHRSWLCPRKRFSSIFSRARSVTSSSRILGMAEGNHTLDRGGRRGGQGERASGSALLLLLGGLLVVLAA